MTPEPAPGAGEPIVHRAPMRSRDDAVPEGLAVERALACGLCGVGGRLDRHPDSLDTALAAVDARYGERVARRVERFATAPDGSFVWTRDADGLLWLGRLTGPWRYDPSAEAAAADLVHVRPCAWLETPVPEPRVPDAVRVSFARGGRNWQRIGADGAGALTSAIWASRHDG